MTRLRCIQVVGGLVCLLAGVCPVAAQPFTLINVHPESDRNPLFTPPLQLDGDYLLGQYHGAAAWADVDGNGYLDLLTAGVSPTVIRSGLGQLLQEENRVVQARLNRLSLSCPPEGECRHLNALTSVDVPGIVYSDLAWTEFDGDGNLDLAVAGATALDAPYAPLLRVYRGQALTFTEATVDAEGVYGAALAWGDYDNDGDADLLVMGRTEAGAHRTRLFRNEPGGAVGRRFVDSGLTFPGLAFGDVAWGDYDADGDLDLALMGALPSAGFRTVLFRNDGGTFTDVTDEGALPQLGFGSLAWGDYDNDGDLDLLASGALYGVFLLDGRTYVLRNDGGRFTPLVDAPSGVFYGEAAWGDYDNDGDLDIIDIGLPRPGALPQTRILRNDVDHFTENPPVEGLERRGLQFGTADWIDLDTDGDLDVSYMGLDGLVRHRLGLSGAVLLPSANDPPGAPDGLVAERTDGGILLAWTAAEDDRTPTPGLTYNLRVGTAPRSSDVVAPLASPDGTRRVTAMGNAGSATSRLLRDLPPGRYYWSVQALDAAFAGSAFAPEQTFFTGDPNDTTPPSPPTALAAVLGDGQVLLTWSPGPDPDVGRYQVYRGTAPGQGTLLVSLPGNASEYLDSGLANGTTYYYRVKAADGSGNESAFSEEIAVTPTGLLREIQLPGATLLNGDLAWGDFNSDGLLDLVTGSNTSNFGGDGSQLFLNLGASFALLSEEPDDLTAARVAWGDYDGDADLDLAIVGGGINASAALLYRNDNGTLIRVDAGLPGMYRAALAWGDYDNDGDLDLVVTGYLQGETAATHLYRNDEGTFTSVATGLPGAALGDAAWVDFDGDADLDLFLTGVTAQNVLTSDLYRNDGGAFTAAGLGLETVAQGSAAWGDYDADGDPDLVLAGNSSQGAAVFLYRNDGGTMALDTTLPWPGSSNLRAALGDVTNDGRLDLAVAALDRMVIYQYANGVLAPFITQSGVEDGILAFGDVDGDLDLDFAVARRPFVSVYQVNLLPRNTSPEAPAGLAATVDGTTARLSWRPAADAQTPQPALTYNVRLGTAPGASDVVSAMARGDGRLLLPSPGNAGQRLDLAVRELAPGTYYWSVQALDAGYAGSAFAPEQSFVVPAGAMEVRSE